MKFNEFKEKTSRTNQFAQVDTLGSYDFFTANISFDALEESDVRAVPESFLESPISITGEGSRIKPDLYEKLIKILPLAAHEYTHFIDSTSTIWGLNHLNLMNAAYLSNSDLGGREHDFHKAKYFHDHTLSIRLPAYFTVINKDAENVQPWYSSITAGKRFGSDGKLSEKPVLFSNFMNSKGKHLARSPISTISILEASAMSQELLISMELLSQTEEDFRLVETQILKRKFLAHIFDKKLTEYSVCAHVLAMQQNCPDIISAFNLCGMLCRFVLDSTEEIYTTALESGAIEAVLGYNSNTEYYSRIQSGLRYRDMGVLFFLLCHALPPDSYKNKQSAVVGVNIAVEKLGYKMKLWEVSRAATANIIFERLCTSEIYSVKELANAARLNHKQICPLTGILDFHSLHMPPARFSDSTIAHIFRSQHNYLTDFDIGRCFDELYKGQQWVTRFSEACLGEHEA